MRERKKICHFTTVHSINDGRIFTKECTSLAAIGFEVILIAFGEKEFDEIKNGVRCISLNSPVKNRLDRFMKRSRAVFKKAVEIDAEIYHFHDPELLPVGLKLKKKGKKVIYDSHEDFPRQVLEKGWIPKLFRRILSYVAERVENEYVRNFDAVVTVSEHIKKRFILINPEVIVCHNYASLNEFETVTKWDNDDRENVCYVGTISKLRGFYEIIEASSRAGVPLELAGVSYSTEIKKMLNSNEFLFHGFADRKKVKSIFSKSFAGLVTFLPAPNHINANPNKLFEYMAAGLPVICSNFKTWEETIKKYDLGIAVDPTNIEEIKDAIKLLNENKDLARRMGENGRKAFEKEYNWGVEEEKLFELYLKL